MKKFITFIIIFNIIGQLVAVALTIKGMPILALIEGIGLLLISVSCGYLEYITKGGGK